MTTVAPRPIRSRHTPLLGPLASLKLTVVLFALAMVLVFIGTLAQTRSGLWVTMSEYFRTPVAWVELSLILPAEWVGTTRVPYPGGWLIGGALLVNLVAAHAVRFRLTWRKSGIILTHLGLIVLLLSELVTGVAANEGQMMLREGQTSNYVQDIREVELAFVTRTDEGTTRHVVIDDEALRRSARTEQPIRDPRLPVLVNVVRYMPNSALTSAAMLSPMDNPANTSLGRQWVAVERDPVAGAVGGQQVDLPSVYVELSDAATGQYHGIYLASVNLDPRFARQTILAGDREYELELRFRRRYLPYTLTALEVRHDRYPGSNIPSNFSSRVQLDDPLNDEHREVVIRMNEPLRHAGDAFYQFQMSNEADTTTFQVVRNPGWLMPYISGAVIALGLVIQFGMSLNRSIGRVRKEAAP